MTYSIVFLAALDTRNQYGNQVFSDTCDEILPHEYIKTSNFLFVLVVHLFCFLEYPPTEYCPSE
ncbi:hypothetical protein C7Y66_13165 [Chroococcidiopsis sp. CCALA 051]|nr:hypothetical protein C7Y66_13165 [Chroococcidiopsis sp. CCALA 051]